HRRSVRSDPWCRDLRFYPGHFRDRDPGDGFVVSRPHRGASRLMSRASLFPTFMLAVQPCGYSPVTSSTVTRWLILLQIPRIEGSSSRTTLWFTLVRPRLLIEFF